MMFRSRVAMLVLFALAGALIGLSFSFEEQKKLAVYRQDKAVRIYHEVAQENHVFMRRQRPYGRDFSR